MKHTTVKLVSLLCVTLLLAFAAILVVFHFTINNNIRTNANEAIEYVVEKLNYDDLLDEDFEFYGSDGDVEEPSTTASCLYVDDDYITPSYELGNRSELVQWCKEHPCIGGATEKIGLGDRQYFVAQVDNVSELNNGRGIWIVYADVTAETALIHRIDIEVLVIMVLCALIACFTGIRIGVSIERDQERQKKFFENASHELKTPLMSIQGYAEGIYSGVIHDQKHAVSVIMNETDKMAALVDEILCLSRIESGETKLQLESVSVEEVVNNCLVSLENVILKKGLQVEMHLSGGEIQADAPQFETAVINLLANAAKYAAHRIVITYDGKSLSIWDDGCELTREDAAHLFDRFYIGKNGSTGIGLALTKEIIEKHGWRITAENRENGPQFTIRFGKL